MTQNNSEKYKRDKSYNKSYNTNSPKSRNLDDKTSPYNFISLIDVVVKSDFNIEEHPHDKFHENLYSGEIEIEIETKSDIFIGGKMLNEWPKEFDFYKCGDTYAIPGSSLRGMTRNLLEIVSFAKFNMTDDKRKIYFRTFASKYKRLRDYYNDKIKYQDDNGNFIYGANSCFLTKEGKYYYIYEVEEKFEEITCIIQVRKDNDFAVIFTFGNTENNQSVTKVTKNVQYLVNLSTLQPSKNLFLILK